MRPAVWQQTLPYLQVKTKTWSFTDLLYKVVRLFCLKFKISITTEPIEFSVIGKVHIGPGMVLGYY